MAPYYDTVRNPSTLRQRAISEKALRSLSSLRNAKPDKSPDPVSLWGREHLFALRVVCEKQPATGDLSILTPHLPPRGAPLPPCIQALIDGPNQNNSTLSQMSEPEIVRSYSPDSLGSVWAAFGALLRDKNGPGGSGGSSDRPSRSTEPIQRFGDYVPSDSFQIGSSPPDDRPPSSNSSGSIGYTENSQTPSVEDLTVRMANCFIRLVLNYGQVLSSPIFEFRDERLTVSHVLAASPRSAIQAVDDGGVRMFHPRGKDVQVAMLEAKRCFQAIDDGKPVVSDGLLAQMVGQAVVSLLDEEQETVSRSNVITIHATRHYVKFFHFQASPSYLQRVASLSPEDTAGPCLSVKSSEWFDLGTKKGREMTVRHLLALVKWARSVATEEDEAGEEEEEFEDDEEMEED
ncbi:d7e97f78-b2a0-49c4-900a-46db6049e10d [Thermothielavioides terrestris]|uniref:Uncharacterized protein n=2 Tax=Thermothielavioides terrestris TaxID=2587410 RepID=G2RFB2_THETT|nr:uncharacterized protein THITE_2121792 [Thermothielavioides terrestris NRRL 8126]AEO70395.1 hypothetical protein THITE_2121792 [Thermothielavioides terrestris NRRL 8126]SPQ18215.1 d7e97f78-b2a0-49c4-900a-46db6049e10d [Thermothielavioides terrestris]